MQSTNLFFLDEYFSCTCLKIGISNLKFWHEIKLHLFYIGLLSYKHLHNSFNYFQNLIYFTPLWYPLWNITFTLKATQNSAKITHSTMIWFMRLVIILVIILLSFLLNLLILPFHTYRGSCSLSVLINWSTLCPCPCYQAIYIADCICLGQTFLIRWQLFSW